MSIFYRQHFEGMGKVVFPRQDCEGGGGVPPTGTAQHVLAARRAVCLWRSRRGTFLFC